MSKNTNTDTVQAAKEFLLNAVVPAIREKYKIEDEAKFQAALTEFLARLVSDFNARKAAIPANAESKPGDMDLLLATLADHGLKVTIKLGKPSQHLANVIATVKVEESSWNWKKWGMIALGVAATTAAGYAGYNYLQKRKANSAETALLTNQATTYA